MPSGLQTHLRLVPHTLEQHCWLVVQSLSFGVQPWQLPLEQDPAQQEGPAPAEQVVSKQQRQLTGLFDEQLRSHLPPQGRPASQPRHFRFLRLQLPEAQWRLRRQLPPVGRRQAVNWQTASPQAAQSSSLSQVLGTPRPGQAAAFTPISPSASPVSAAMRACMMPRRERPEERARVRVSKREPSMRTIPGRNGTDTTHRMQADTPAPLYAGHRALPSAQPAPEITPAAMESH